jgi:hypothetical protein
MNIGIKVTRDEAIQKTTELEYKTKTPVRIGRVLSQRIVRQEMIEKLMNHKVYGAIFTTLKNKEVSNTMLTNICAKIRCILLICPHSTSKLPSDTSASTKMV